MENGELSTRFEAKQTGEICLLDKIVKNGSYKSTLRLETKYGSYDYGDGQGREK